VPRRFAFRHPVVPACGLRGGRRAGGGSERTGGRRRRSRDGGAGAVERAHHVEQAAGAGDEAAIALLSEAAVALQSPAPATAARYHAAALRLMPAGAEGRTRVQLRLSEAQAAAGDAAGARDTLLDALRTAAPEDRSR
jgi:hypothetical protein